MTAQQLINAALRTLGVLASGEAPNAEESADGLTALNGLLDSWTALGLPIYQITRESFTLTGPASYTIGPAQSFNTVRPVRIKAASVEVGTVENGLEIIGAEQWAAVLDKSRTGKFADVLYFDGGFPTGVVYLMPAPLTGATLKLYCYKPLGLIAVLGDSVTLPPGYDRALIFNLAQDLAPQYGRQMAPEAVASANEAKGAITGLNAIVLGEQTAAAGGAA